VSHRSDYPTFTPEGKPLTEILSPDRADFEPGSTSCHHLAAAMRTEQGILQPDPADELRPLDPLLPLEGGGFLDRHQEVHLTPLPIFRPATR
jgi:hypothetical protein